MSTNVKLPFTGGIHHVYDYKGCSIGQSAYHLSEDPTNCYMDASLAKCSLDDGMNIPDKLFFQDVEFDATTRTFKGCLKYPTAVLRGCSRFQWTCVFREDYEQLVNGTV